jgi:hypothetical protein
MMRTNAPTTLDKRVNDLFALSPDIFGVPFADMLVLLFPADVGGIGFNELAFTAQRVQSAARVHSFTNAVGKMPSGFHAAIEHPLNLAGADTFLAGAHQVNNLQPQVQRQMAIFKNGPLPNSEGLTAGIALAKPNPAAFARQPPSALRCRAAMGANRAIRPQSRLNMRKGSFFIVEMGCAQNRFCHTSNLL